MNRDKRRVEKAKERKVKKGKAKQLKTKSGLQFGVLDERIKELAKVTVTLYQNQQRLAQSVDSLVEASDQLDEQFAVLSRMTTMQLNEIAAAFNTVTGAMPGTPPRISPVVREDVTLLFEAWREFKQRLDFRKHNTAWFMGEDLTKLPPPPPPAKEEKTNLDAPQENLGGAEVFGGDYDQSNHRDQTTAEEGPKAGAESPPAEVPQVRTEGPPQAR